VIAVLALVVGVVITLLVLRDARRIEAGGREQAEAAHEAREGELLGEEKAKTPSEVWATRKELTDHLLDDNGKD
jgi:hypothetical protein